MTQQVQAKRGYPHLKFSGAFTKAAQNGELATVQNYVDHQGRNVNHATRLGKNTALIASAKSSQYDVVKYLLQHPQIDINKKNFKSETAIVEAVKNGNINIVLILAAKGAQLNKAINKLAFKHGHPYLARILELIP